LKKFGRRIAMAKRFKLNAGAKQIAVPVVIAVICVVVIFAVLIRRFAEPEYTVAGSLDETVMTIDGNAVTLRDTGVYIANVEALIDAMARTYDPDNPQAFWKVHFSAGENSTFTNDYAKTYVQNLYVYDYVMEREAVKKGLSLTTAQTAEAQSEGKAAYANLTDKAKEMLGLTEEAVIAVYIRKKLVSVYVNSVAKEMTDSGYEGDDLSTQLNVDGEFYNNSIKTQYDVKIVEKQWEKLPMGYVTIN
jgi:hypothetical protein